MHHVSLFKEEVAHEDAFLFVRSSAVSSGDYRGGSFNIAVILTLVTSPCLSGVVVNQQNPQKTLSCSILSFKDMKLDITLIQQNSVR